MKRKLLLMLAAIVSLSSGVYAASNNYISSMQHVKNGASLANESFHIEPYDEIETGASILITFHNAIVFSQDIIDGSCSSPSKTGYRAGGYQYKINGSAWDRSEGFYDIMPQTNTSQLPYSIKRISDEQIQVYLCNLPDDFAGESLEKINGSGRRPYYKIPLVAYADGIGEATIDVDPNGTGITGDSGYKSNSNIAPATESTTALTTEAATETTTEASVEASTETEPVNTVEVQIGSRIMYVNGNTVEIDAAPYIQAESSSTMIPLRAVSEALYGGEDTVGWDAVSKTVTIRYNENVVSFTIGSDTMDINGSSISMANGVKAEIKDGRTFIPFRALGNALNAKVSWYSETKTARFN